MKPRQYRKLRKLMKRYTGEDIEKNWIIYSIFARYYHRHKKWLKANDRFTYLTLKLFACVRGADLKQQPTYYGFQVDRLWFNVVNAIEKGEFGILTHVPE